MLFIVKISTVFILDGTFLEVVAVNLAEFLLVDSSVSFGRANVLAINHCITGISQQDFLVLDALVKVKLNYRWVFLDTLGSMVVTDV